MPLVIGNVGCSADGRRNGHPFGHSISFSTAIVRDGVHRGRCSAELIALTVNSALSFVVEIHWGFWVTHRIGARSVSHSRLNAV